ncbi:MAG: lytic transglycosylase domain-containing protein [Elusimicrobiota bacterium]
MSKFSDLSSLVISCFILLEFVCFAQSGRVFLKNGRSISGDVFSQGNKIFVCFDNGSVQLEREEVKSIDYIPSVKEKSNSFLRLLKKTPSLVPAKADVSSPYDGIIHQAAQTHRVDPALVKAVMRAESNFNSGDVSCKGAKGLMQLMPETAKLLGIPKEEIFNPEKNILGGTKYLSDMLGLFDGNITLALAAYNAGPQTVKRYGDVPPYKETQGYIKNVYKYYNYYKQDRPDKLKKILYSYRDKDGKLYITDLPAQSHYLR